MAAVSYILSSLLRINTPSLIGRLAPSAFNVLSAIFTLYIWNYVLNILDMFSGREQFEAHTAAYQGERLRQVMLDDADTMSIFDAKVRTVRTLYVVQLVVLAVLILLSTILDASAVKELQRAPSPLLIIIPIAVMLCGAGILSLLGFYLRDLGFASEGITLTGPGRTTGLVGMGLFVSAVAGISLILSAGRNWIPFSLVQYFFAWLGSLITRTPPPAREISLAEYEAGDPPMADMMLNPAAMGLGDRGEGGKFWTYLQWAVVILVVLLFAWFMLEPLINRRRDGKGASLAMKIRKFLAQWLKSMRYAIANFFKAFRAGKGVRLNRPNADALKRMSEDIFAAYSAGKRKEIRQSVTLFARLIIWGQDTRKVIWRATLGPAEFCALLSAAPEVPPEEETVQDASSSAGTETADVKVGTGAKDAGKTETGKSDGKAADKVAGTKSEAKAEPKPMEVKPIDPALARDIVRCGDLFEEALYGPSELSEDKRVEFKKLVERITA
jgi:ABC-type multidrug transport system fused ATPase/permease subunit